MTNTEVVRAVTTALEQGDVLLILTHMLREIIWTVRGPDVLAVPWIGVYSGRRGIAALLGALAAVNFVEAVQTSLTADGETVVTTSHLVFDDSTGRRVECDETQVWRLTDGKIASVDVQVGAPPVAAGAT